MHTSKLRQALARHADISEKKLKKRHPHAASWFAKRGISPGDIRHHAARFASAGALAGAVLMGAPLIPKGAAFGTEKIINAPVEKIEELFSKNLKSLLPPTVHPLNPEVESLLSQMIKEFWGIKATAVLDGNHLNTSYGYMGAEQHLPRFPGDSVGQHDAYQQSGITPGKGAWGYFANSKSEMTDDLIQKEKYYVAVQTLYLPDWETNLAYLRDWYKHRKVLVVNPANGKTIVAVVADSGPAKFTGKSFGASPEVMHYLEMKDGAQKGPAILFFVDDKDNMVPLGPVERRLP